MLVHQIFAHGAQRRHQCSTCSVPQLLQWRWSLTKLYIVVAGSAMHQCTYIWQFTGTENAWQIYKLICTLVLLTSDLLLDQWSSCTMLSCGDKSHTCASHLLNCSEVTLPSMTEVMNTCATALLHLLSSPASNVFDAMVIFLTPQITLLCFK